MRPKELGQGSAGDWPGPGDPAAVTPAPPPAANPAPEPSAEPEPAPVQVPAAGLGAGSGSATVSGPSAGSVPNNSDAPWTRFIFQGPFGPRAAGLGTGKAAGIWKTPAAYIGRRPGVSGPERAAFIRELEEALCPDLRPPVKKITQEDVKVMLSLLEERERDLNTAARIGQSLVKQNSVLMEENSKLEAMLGSAREEILHLRHQVSLRDDLLQLFSDSDDDEEEEEEEEEEDEGEEEEEQGHDHSYEASDPTPLTESESHRCPQLEALQEQLRLLEEENEQLREEVSQLDDLEEEEQMFILDCVEQFSEASQQMVELSEVLALRMENYEQQQREVAQLRAQVMKLQRCCRSVRQVGKASGLGVPGSQQSLGAGSQLQDLREKYSECGSMLIEAQEEVKTLRQQASTGSVTHYTYTVPLEALPDFQETLAEELRMSIRRIISDPVFFMERCTLGPRPLPALEALPAEEGVTEEAELVSEEAEAWEEVELELDEATQMNVVMSALEASGLGPSHLDMKYVLQQLANWQDAHYRQQLRQKMLQKGSPTLQQWQQQAKTNMGGGIVEEQLGVPTQDFRRLEEERVNHPPRAWEEEGPSGATQAIGTKASASKGRSRTSPLGESEGELGSPTG
uniref:Huntingtin associated protein 1 n=1 Tax=Balaenoptera musculus TaxID=9771 RepID=A0A8C0DRC4_BALMU